MIRLPSAKTRLGFEASQLLETLPVSILRSDETGKVVFANLTARLCFGENVLGTSVESLYDTAPDLPYSDPRVVKAELIRREDNCLTNVSVPVRIHDGSSREMLCSFRWHKDIDCVDAVIIEGTTEVRRSLLRISESMIRPGRLEDILSVITTEARRLSGADRAYLKLHDPAKDVLDFKALASTDSLEEFPESFSSTTRGMTGHVFQTRQPYRSDDVSQEPSDLYYKILDHTVSKVAVPLLYSFSEDKGAPLVCYGVLCVDGFRASQFGPDTEDILKTLASHAAIAISHATLLQETKTTFAELLQGVRSTQNATLAANILHDGKNMVRGVIHEVEAVTNELADKQFMRRRHRDLESRLNKLKDLLDTIDELVRTLRLPADGHGDKRALEVVDLERLAQRVATIVPIPEAAIVIRVRSDLSPCNVYGRKTQLLLMIYNLVVNAVNAMRGSARSGTIDISLTNAPNRSGFRRIQVSDEGPGLGKNVLNILRGAEQYSATPGGLGVGLLTVREAIKDLNGSLAVDSKLGSGTTFTIDLPGA
jgi:signal transduction histidine kinase